MLAFSLFCLPSHAQETPAKAPSAQAAATAAKVDGLELQAESRRGPIKEAGQVPACTLVIVSAETKGTSVRFRVFGTDEFSESDKSVAVVSPRDGGVSVLAIALVDGKLTDFAVFSFSSVPASGPGVPPTPSVLPGSTPAQGRLRVTIVEDQSQGRTFASWKPGISALGHVCAVYSWQADHATLKAYGLDAQIAKAGRLPALIVQREQMGQDGKLVGPVVYAQPLPGSEAELQAILRQLGGK